MGDKYIVEKIQTNIQTDHHDGTSLIVKEHSISDFKQSRSMLFDGMQSGAKIVQPDKNINFVQTVVPSNKAYSLLNSHAVAQQSSLGNQPIFTPRPHDQPAHRAPQPEFSALLWAPRSRAQKRGPAGAEREE